MPTLGINVGISKGRCGSVFPGAAPHARQGACVAVSFLQVSDVVSLVPAGTGSIDNCV